MPIPTFNRDFTADEAVAFHFTPAEWRLVLEDLTFLTESDNSYAPRRLMGIRVEIVPDHQFG